MEVRDHSLTLGGCLQSAGLFDAYDAISEACDVIKACYRNVEQAEVKAEALDQKLLKVQSKIRNLRDMRMEGDIDPDDFHDRMKKLIDEENGLRMEINNLTQFLAKKEPEAGPDMDAIKASLERITDFSEGDIDRELIDVFVPRIIARENGSFIWYLNLSGKSLAEISAIVEGRKNKATVSLTDIMEQKKFFRLSDLRKVADDSFSAKESKTRAKLHRQL